MSNVKPYGSCCVKNCNSKRIKGSSLTFFTFPGDEPEYKVWLELCGISKDYNHRVRYYICEFHFQLDYSGQKRLPVGRRPSLLLPSRLESENGNKSSQFELDFQPSPSCSYKHILSVPIKDSYIYHFLQTRKGVFF